MGELAEISITPRDERLLLDCYRNGALSFSQMGRRYFADATKSTVCNRLSKLRRAGLLRNYRLGTQVHHGAPKKIGVIYFVTKQALRLLQSRYPHEQFREDPVPLNTLTLAHDLMLADVIEALERRFAHATISSSKILGSTLAQQKRLPDAVIEFQGSKSKWAIELELTAKSNHRYREIITSYRLMPAYEKVLYVVSGKAIARKIQAQILGHAVPLDGLCSSTGKFYFVHFDELLGRPGTALMTSGTLNLTPPGQAHNGLGKGE